MVGCARAKKTECMNNPKCEWIVSQGCKPRQGQVQSQGHSQGQSQRRNQSQSEGRNQSQSSQVLTFFGFEDDELKTKIERMGVKVTSSLSDRTSFILIKNPKEINKGSHKKEQSKTSQNQTLKQNQKQKKEEKKELKQNVRGESLYIPAYKHLYENLNKYHQDVVSIDMLLYVPSQDTYVMPVENIDGDVYIIIFKIEDEKKRIRFVTDELVWITKDKNVLSKTQDVQLKVSQYFKNEAIILINRAYTLL